MEFRTFLLFGEVAIYFVLMIVIGMITKKWISSMSDFFTSGRELSSVTIGLGLAGIMFSGATLPTISGFAITHSLWIGSLYMWGWAVGIIVFGKYFATAIRRSGVITLPEWVEVRFDSKTRTVVAVATSIAAFGSLFAQVVGLGNNITALTGIPYWGTTLGIVILCTFYMYAGGFWALSISDMSHMTVIIIAFIVCMIYLFTNVAGPIEVLTNSPGADIRVGTFLGYSPEGFMTGLQFPSFISLLFGWFLCMVGCQYYWMRAVGGRTETAVKKGYYLSGGITILFGSTLLAMFGTYALYMFGEDAVTSATAFGMIIGALPVGLDGLMLVALVAGCMSTFSTALLGVSSPLTRDVYQKLIAPNANAEQLTKASRIITIAVAIISYMFALLWSSGAAHALAVMWAFSAPTAVVVGLSFLWKRVTVKAAFWAELFGLVLTMGWYISGKSGIIHPMWVGFFVTLAVIVVVTLATPPKYYGTSDYVANKASTQAGLAQTNVVACVKNSPSKEEQDAIFSQAMKDVMRPWFGTKKYKAMIERHHNETYTLADFMFPHITGRTMKDVSTSKNK